MKIYWHDELDDCCQTFVRQRSTYGFQGNDIVETCPHCQTPVELFLVESGIIVTLYYENPGYCDMCKEKFNVENRNCHHNGERPILVCDECLDD